MENGQKLADHVRLLLERHADRASRGQAAARRPAAISHGPAAHHRAASGVAFIVCNEAAERFSFYGMKAILVKFMTEHLCTATGELATMGDAEARVVPLVHHRDVPLPDRGRAARLCALVGTRRSSTSPHLLRGACRARCEQTRLGLVGLLLIAVGAVSAHPRAP